MTGAAASSGGATAGPSQGQASQQRRRGSSQSVRDMQKRLRRWRSGIFYVALFSIVINLLMLTVPIYLMQLSDRVLASGSHDTLIMLTIAAVGAILMLSLFDSVRKYLLTRIGIRFEAELGGPLLAASIDATAAGAPGEVQGLRDMGQVKNFLTSSVVPLIFDLPVAPLYILAVYLIHPHLGWITVIGGAMLVMFALMNQFATTGPLSKSSGHSMNALSRAHAQARNADSVRAMGMLPDCVRLWGEENSEALENYRAANDRNAIVTGLSKLSRLLLQIAVLGWGAVLTLKGEVTAGAAIAASIVGARALAPLEGAIEGWRSLLGATQAYGRVHRLLMQFAGGEDRVMLPEPKGLLSIEKLTYLATGTRDPIIRGISFDVPPGTLVAMIGMTGAGKSTLGRMLVGAADPADGSVRLDGSDLRHWDPLQRGEYIGYLPQGVELFPGTIAENIARLRKDVASEDIIKAAKFAGAHDLIVRQRNGYETRLQLGGAPLSGGERQRVALARAFFGNPKVVVLDEPDANLDREGELALLNCLLEAKKRGISVIMITQRPAILRHVDRILALAEGRIEAYGPRDQLLRRPVDGPDGGGVPPQTTGAGQAGAPGGQQASRKPIETNSGLVSASTLVPGPHSVPMPPAQRLPLGRIDGAGESAGADTGPTGTGSKAEGKGGA